MRLAASLTQYLTRDSVRAQRLINIANAHVRTIVSCIPFDQRRLLILRTIGGLELSMQNNLRITYWANNPTTCRHPNNSSLTPAAGLTCPERSKTVKPGAGAVGMRILTR